MYGGVVLSSVNGALWLHGSLASTSSANKPIKVDPPKQSFFLSGILCYNLGLLNTSSASVPAGRFMGALCLQSSHRVALQKLSYVVI